MSGNFEPFDLAVIGGGISGLTCAHWAARQGRSVVLFEAASSAGGCITTVRSDSYIADGGPQSFLGTKNFTQLVKDAGLEPLLLPASPAAARPYLFVRGRLVPVPQSPQQALLSPLLSPAAKLRALAEPMVRRSEGGDESVAAFVRRRAGAAVLNAVVQPYVAGIFAGDPAKLSMHSAFPTVAAFEQQYGSVLRGVIASRRASHDREGSANGERPKRRVSYAFRGGNDVLPRTLAAQLGTGLYLNSPVMAMWQRGEWMELLVGGVSPGRVVAKSVVLATNASAAANLIDPLEGKAAEALRSVEYPTVVQIALAYPRNAIGVPLDGFGFLVPRTEGMKIMGCVWNSTMFPDRCPEDQVLLTVFLGGALDPSVSAQSDEELARLAHQDVTRVLKLRECAPRVVAGFRWHEAIPQYMIGHTERLSIISRYMHRLPKVKLCGSYLQGLSVSDCIASARAALDGAEVKS